MAWHLRKGAYEIYVYNPAKGRKQYVGRRKLERDARKLFRDKTEEFAGPVSSETTIRDYAAEWLNLHHGPGTRRPSPTTRRVNEGLLRQFLAEFGDRRLDGGVSRKEALTWSKPRPHAAKTASAMLNDAVDDEECKANPFANRRHTRSRERRDIAPITQAELDTLERIALEHWGSDGYGLIARAWVLFSAWVGCRPGETFTVPLRALDIPQGLVTVKRCKPPYRTDTVVLPKAAGDAVRDALPLLAHEGPMFRTPNGKLLSLSGRGYYWGPIRDRFRETVTVERWEALTEGQPDLSLYSLRHRVASVMADRGATAPEIALQLGNTAAVCERTYIHPFEVDVRERNRRLLDSTVVDLKAARDRRGA